MAKALIPLRPKGAYAQLTENEKDCLTWIVLSGRNRLECFIEFVRPDMEKSPHAKKYCEQFFAVADTRNYIKDYEETIADFLTPKKKRRDESEILDPDKVMKKLGQKVLRTINDSEEESVATISDEINLAKPFGWLKEGETQAAPPMRYLPERCGSCAYKKFIDEQVELGNIIEEIEEY